MKGVLNAISAPAFPVPGLHLLVQRMPPVVAAPTPEPAVFTLNWLSATGTAILVAALVAGLFMGFSPKALAREYLATIKVVRASLLTIAAMLALGFVSRYSGMDAILGLAFAKTGVWYPFFGAMLGWLGVALTGSDTSSNVLFGSLQVMTAQQVGVSPTLMAAANSSGGVMGKMIDAQSIVVASTATRWDGQEGTIAANLRKIGLKAGMTKEVAHDLERIVAQLKLAENESQQYLEKVNAALAEAFAQFGNAMSSQLTKTIAESDAHLGRGVSHLTGVVQELAMALARMKKS